MPPKELSVQESAQMIVRHLLNVHPGENVVIVCDPDSEMAMAHALAKEVEQIGAEFTIAIMPNRQQKRANELPRPIAKGLEDADCLIGLTRSSGAPTYAKEVKALYNAKRLRTISMVMRDIRNFTTNGALADYRALYEEGKRLAEIWRKARRIRVQTPLGTDFIADIGKSSPIIECGFATEKGQEAAFPDGEVSQGPNEGRVRSVESAGKAAEALRRILNEIENADNIAEIGIGLNPLCARNGDFEDEKKARGNVHIALGNNIFYGGQTYSDIHMDMVLYHPTVWLDETIVVRDGHLCL